ncbi:MAG: GNAT family N-acetyltransferase [Acetanaerobacterium sp.]
MKIRPLKIEELDEALALAWRVFEQFDAPEYSEQGIQHFRDSIMRENMLKRISIGELRFWCCEQDKRLVGIIAVRQHERHICLLFVDKAYHRRGIASAMIETAIEGWRSVTAYSSPYAVEIYKRLGFRATDVECIRDGMRFTPMRKEMQDYGA